MMTSFFEVLLAFGPTALISICFQKTLQGELQMSKWKVAFEERIARHFVTFQKDRFSLWVKNSRLLLSGVIESRSNITADHSSCLNVYWRPPNLTSNF